MTARPFARLAPLAGLTFAAAAALPGTAPGQCDLARLAHSDRAPNDLFGAALSLSSTGSGPVCAAGMWSDDTASGVNAGSVRFFSRANNQWGEATWLKLEAADGGPGEQYGISISYRDPFLIVGANEFDNGGGASYVYQRFGSSWVQEAKLVNPSPLPDDWFGAAVAISNGWAIVGASQKDFDTQPVSGVEHPNAGAAYIYRRNANGAWSLNKTIENVTAFGANATNQWLGSSVDIHVPSGGGTALAVVGVPYGEDFNAPSGHGLIHVFKKLPNDTWDKYGSLLYLHDVRVQAYDYYGFDVSTDGARIAVGAPGTDLPAGHFDAGSPAQASAGCVYILRAQSGEWVTEQRIFAPDAAALGQFGWEVVVRGDLLLVSDSPSEAESKCYLFERDPATGLWASSSTYRTPTVGGGFGTGLALDSTWAMMGHPADSVGILNGGAMFAAAVASEFSDSCEGATPIELGSHSGCTDNALDDGRATTCGGGFDQGPDVWASFVPRCSGPVIMTTAGSLFDTVLSVHSACPDSSGANAIVCDDDAGPGNTSQLTLNAVAGQAYLIRIAGFGGTRGAFSLGLTAGSAPGNDTCSSPTSVASGGTYSFSTCSATPSAGLTACSGLQVSGDVWFRFDAPPATGTLRLSLCGSNFDTVVSLYNTANCPAAANEIACNDDGNTASPCYGTASSYLSTSVQGGFPYLIRIAGYPGGQSTGDGLLQVTYTPNCRCDWNQSGALSVQDIFDFLAAYFSGSADFNVSGATTVQDIFDFLACYFAGCV